MPRTKRNMNKEQFLKVLYICLAIVVILMTAYIGFSYTMSAVEKVNAEEISDNAILNFNQLYNPIYNKSQTTTSGITHQVIGQKVIVSGTATANVYVNTSYQINMKANHIYYLTGLSGTATGYNALSIFPDGARQNSNVLEITSNRQLIKWNNDYLSTIYLQFSNNATYNGEFYINIIDLSQMFGVGNEPQTIEEIKAYLPLDYYNYTTGAPVSFNYLDGYNNGAFAMQDGFTIEEVASDFINNAYSISTEYFNKVENGIAFDGTIGINTQYTLLANDYIILDLLSFSESGYQFDITQIDSNGNEVVLQHINTTEMPNQWVSGSGFSYGSGTYTIKLVNDTNTIRFKGQCILNVESIKYKTFNYSQAIVDAFKNGKNSVNTKVYYDRGFDDGKNWQINHNTSNAWGSSWDFISSSFNGIGEILSIEIFDKIPLWTFIAIPLLFGLITFIFKITGN